MRTKSDTVSQMLNFIDNSPSCYHAIENLSNMLSGFEKLEEGELWKMKRGGSYYVVRGDSSMIAFTIPKGKLNDVRITTAHSDSPSFKVKTDGAMVTESHYTRINTEKYGGMLMAQWLDRPLSVAGRVIVRDKKGLRSILVNIDRDILLIPSVAIHMNRDANEGYKYNAKVDTIPLFGDENARNSFEDLISEASGVKKEDILGSDLFLYNRQKGTKWGANNEFISSRALDDLQCAFALVTGFTKAKQSANSLSLCCIFDNEETGSLTRQGADSTFLKDTIDRIKEVMGISNEEMLRAIANGFMISADNAHAVHPNHPEYADVSNRPYLNGGIVIKYNANQKYTTDAYSEAMMRDICKRAKVPVQTYSNRPDIAGGSTLGNIANRHISIKTVDIGLPQLSMHSPYETAGSQDAEYLIQAVKVFYEG